MLFAYLHCFSTQYEFPELCIIADKPDQFSVPVRVDALIETYAAVIRIGPIEAIKVMIDQSDGGKIIEPVSPAKLFVTPSLPDRPGVQVKSIKVIKTSDGRYQSYYMQDSKGRAKDNWRPFNANEVQL